MKKVTIKNKEEIEIMRQGGSIAASVLENLKKAAKPGMTVLELDALADREIIKAGATPSFKGFKGYPAATCISVNEEIVHGIPTARKIKDGDVVGIDVGVFYKGLHVDTAITIGIGSITFAAKKLIEVTKRSLENGLRQIKPGIHLGDVQAEIQTTIESAGFSVIRDLTGHGVGRELQEAPSIPNYGKAGEGIVLTEGMTLAIEPMVSVGDWHIKVKDDGWTIAMADGSLSAHFEHTVLVTKDGYEILTKKL